MHRIKKKEENIISTVKTHQVLNKWQYLTCIKVPFPNQNNTPRPYVNDSCIIIHIKPIWTIFVYNQT